MINIFTLLLVLMLLTSFQLLLKMFSQNTEKRIEDFKEGFSKGYETINQVKPFEEKQPEIEGTETYSDEDLYYLEGGHLTDEEIQKARVEYVDREDEWRD
jgi:hypothetical protein